MASKYQKVKDQIIELHYKGYSNYAIAEALDKLNPNVGYHSTSIGKALKRFLGDDYKPNFQFSGSEAAKQTGKKYNAVEEIMQNSGFTNGKDAEARLVWDKSNKNYSVLYKMVKDVMTFDQMQKALKEDLKDYTPNFEPIKRKEITEPHLLTLGLFDLHLGKLADPDDTRDEYNHEIAEQRANEGIEGIISKSSGFPLNKILLPIGQDILHVDNGNNTTTKGTRQDVSQTWFRSFTQARKTLVKIIERLLTVADVHVVLNPSNHDYYSCFMLADALYCWFNKNPNITWDIDMNHRKYFKYGNSLIGTTHGDGGSFASLPQSMSHEAKEYWSQCEYYYWYLGHIHHKQKYKFKTSEDIQGVSIEYLRSPSGTDSWHAKSQYANNIKAMDGLITSVNHGQVARLTHVF